MHGKMNLCTSHATLTHFHTSSYLCIGHLSVEHLHLGVDVISLLILIQGPIVPHEKAKCWVELPDIVCPPDPCLFLTVRSKAVATMRVACSYNEHIVWDGLEGKKGGFPSECSM